MAMIERRFYQAVGGSSTVTLDYTVPSGVVLDFRKFGGNAASTPDTEVSIYWDPAGVNELLFSTHGDAYDEPHDKSVTGNGSKVVRIRLRNDQLFAETLGGYWIGAI